MSSRCIIKGSICATNPARGGPKIRNIYPMLMERGALRLIIIRPIRNAKTAFLYNALSFYKVLCNATAVRQWPNGPLNAPSD